MYKTLVKSVKKRSRHPHRKNSKSRSYRSKGGLIPINPMLGFNENPRHMVNNIISSGIIIDEPFINELCQTLTDKNRTLYRSARITYPEFLTEGRRIIELYSLLTNYLQNRQNPTQQTRDTPPPRDRTMPRPAQIYY